MPRAQLSVPALEAAIAILLITTLTVTIAVGPQPPPEGQAQLDALASDALTLLAHGSPEHLGVTRLEELLANPATFQRERPTVARRLDRIFPPNLMYQLQTPHGIVGFEKPIKVTSGGATLLTDTGSVRLEVWYV